ncbi:class I SAM-dependent methyltransferase [Pedobacter psychrodurus]|uniref:Class I SAM-dependent methyltransferase n=1 Tax=Pedobacter psychrodurus TaxID=2530456 RepID=A0A4R0Q6P2_9SPHI|nr:class I SAM-dependent methyltransferase [Pedobacter psychrodurus]TCD28960.1 class I SAM-dependent methyltransferase [Pedobacter psychrodurus]
MLQNFKLYSQYYDLLYQDKDYALETDYIDQLIKQYKPQSKNVIELGSGTGKHANLFSQKGYHIYGIERSAEMVNIANQNKRENIEFQVADISTFEVDKQFDIALSLFHVISYLNRNQDLIHTFQNVHRHLKQGGLFIFDVWHSAAVHALVPEKRTKQLSNEKISVIRNAKPIIYPEQNVVEVNYDIEVTDIESGTRTVFSEKHPMRHFSKPEIELLAFATQFEILHSEEFLTQAAPSVDTWGVCYIFKKI